MRTCPAGAQPRICLRGTTGCRDLVPASERRQALGSEAALTWMDLGCSGQLCPRGLSSSGWGTRPAGIKDKVEDEAMGCFSTFLEQRVLEGLFIYK